MSYLAGLITALAVLSSTLVPTPAFASTGDYDTSFGDGGAVEVPSESRLVGPQGDKILMIDSSGMTRYTSSGELDQSFGVLGRLDRPENMYLTYKGGAILAVGSKDGHPAVQRFTADGQPDPTFNGGQVATTHHDGYAVDAIAQGSKIVLFVRKDAGDSLPVWEERFSGVLTRIDAFGRVDSTFGANGETPTSFVVHVPFPLTFAIGIDIAPSVGLCPPTYAQCWWTIGAAVVYGGLVEHGSGFLVMAYDAGTARHSLKRITNGGVVDPGFNMTPVEPGYLQVASDGSIYIGSGVAGGNQIAMRRLLANGYPDVSFGTNGRAALAVPDAVDTYVAGFAVSEQGVSIAGGRFTGATYDGFIVQTDSAFAPDRSFSAEGFEFRPWGTIRGLVVDAGRFIVPTYEWGSGSRGVSDGRWLLVAYRTEITPVVNDAPSADFTYNCGPLLDGYPDYRECTFDASASNDPDAHALVYGWRTTYETASYCGKYQGPHGKEVTAAGRIEDSEYCAASVTLVVEDEHGAIAKVTKKLEYSEEPPPPPVTLQATAFKQKGVNHVRLEWSDAVAAYEIYRDGSRIAGGITGGTFSDNTGTKGGARFVYQVCSTSDPSRCSDAVTVNT